MRLGLVCLCALGMAAMAAPLKIARYEVAPGNYYKSYGTSCDGDLMKGKDGVLSRKGKLTDGYVGQAPSTGVCYVFWKVPEKDSYITFRVTLEQAAKVKTVRIHGQNLTPSYSVKEASIAAGDDDIDIRPLPGRFKPAPYKGVNWHIDVPVNRQAQTLMLTVWGRYNKYINVTEIQAIGE